VQIMGAGSYGRVGDLVVGVIGRSWAELKGRSELMADLLRKGRQDTVTLVYAARDEEHNHVRTLKRYLNRSK
jgi:uncharacterized protein YeaO (DUF488 family)